MEREILSDKDCRFALIPVPDDRSPTSPAGATQSNSKETVQLQFGHIPKECFRSVRMRHATGAPGH
jgi:hypothetical protein